MRYLGKHWITVALACFFAFFNGTAFAVPVCGIHGELIDAHTGEPVSDGVVTAKLQTLNFVDNHFPSGLFLIYAEPGSGYRVTISGGRLHLPTSRYPINCLSGDFVGVGVIALEPRQATIYGVVVDASTGKPIPYAEVAIQDPFDKALWTPRMVFNGSAYSFEAVVRSQLPLNVFVSAGSKYYPTGKKNLILPQNGYQYHKLALQPVGTTKRLSSSQLEYSFKKYGTGAYKAAQWRVKKTSPMSKTRLSNIIESRNSTEQLNEAKVWDEIIKAKAPTTTAKPDLYISGFQWKAGCNAAITITNKGDGGISSGDFYYADEPFLLEVQFEKNGAVEWSTVSGITKAGMMVGSWLQLQGYKNLGNPPGKYVYNRSLTYEFDPFAFARRNRDAYPTGYVKIRAVVDPDNELVESNEGNNQYPPGGTLPICKVG
jgi:hypothetical protein